ncbi:tripartite tricarboxylate transporter substrate binding protein [Afipia sp. P52-10]|uniref:Bug family tripartite tricarboxylate transporter substrate binding protein n=1 Tax=Afipia sp. P52-10 TaxID=1429916 RepID=UPI0004ADDB04|nr:tripartite tricarboxylate transporter substrate binding protein [Afipia sp. P52-10]
MSMRWTRTCGRRRTALPAASLLTACLLATSLWTAALQRAAADTQKPYPQKPITVVLQFGPGSGTDTTTRLVGQHLSTALGQPVLVDNKPGANGMIAATYVARSAPDGYTLFVTSNTSHSAAPSLMKNLTYDPIKDFTPVARAGNLPFLLVINPDIPAKTVSELTAHAKANPGKLSYGSGNSSAIVMGATYARRAGIDLLHVPYKSAPTALADVIGGRVSMMFIDVLTALPQIEAGKVRPLAVATGHRSSALPELPTMQEAGVADFDINSWVGWFGPANMPKGIVDRLNAELGTIMQTPEIKKQLNARGMEVITGPPQEFERFVVDQLAYWTRLIKDAGIEPE